MQKEIERIVDNKNTQMKNIFYGTLDSNIEITNGAYNPNNCDSINNTSIDSIKDSFNFINCNCKNISGSGIISPDDKDYYLYRESELYKKSEPKLKNLNAYLWYFGTNRLNKSNSDFVKVNNKEYNNFTAFKNKNPKLIGQLNNLACQILSQKAVYLKDSNGDVKMSVSNLLNICSSMSTQL